MASPDVSKLPLVLHQIAIPYILLTVALAIPQQRHVVAAVFLPLLWASYSHLLQTSSPSPLISFIVGSFVVFHALFSLDLLLLRDPRREFQCAAEPHVYPDDDLPRRIGWVLNLVSTMRGVGWNWGVRSFPRDDAATLRMFLWRRVKHLLLLWAWLDATVFWMQQVDAAYFLPEGNSYDSGKGVVVVVYAGLFASSARRGDAVLAPRGFPEVPRDGVRRLLYVCVIHAWRMGLQGTTVYVSIDGMYTELAVVCSAVGGLADAVWPGAARMPWLDWRCWPDLFGGWAHGDWGHGLVGLWGGAWHGLFKYAFTSPSRYICRILQLPPSSPATIALRLFTPFAMSALLHYTGSHTLSSYGWGSARFFLLQPFGILLERVFLHVYRGSTVRWAPYVWVFCWLVLTSPPFLDEVRYGGMWALQLVPVSVCRGVTGAGEGWWAWRRDTRVGWRPWWVWDESLGGWGIRV